MVEHYIGVDLHKAFFQVCAVDPGRAALGGAVSADAEGIAAFVAGVGPTRRWRWKRARRRGISRMRSRRMWGPADCRFAEDALKAGYAAKTDRLDARRLADAFRRDSVVGIYYPPPAIRELRELCRGRHTLVQLRTRLLQRLRAVLLRQGIVEARRLVRQDALLDRGVTAAAAATCRPSAPAAGRGARRADADREVEGRARQIPSRGAAADCRAWARCSRC